MDRRDLLALGAAAALEGCAPKTSFREVPPPPTWTPDEVDAAIADMNATLEKMAASRPDASLFVGARSIDAKHEAHGHDLVVRVLSAMHVAATFRELPADVQKRENVSRLMWRALPMLDEAMLDVRDYIANVSPAERRAIQDELRKDPSVAMDAIGRIDERASAAGVSTRRRMQMRAIATHVTWRMSKQSLDTMLDETLDKVQRVQERHARDVALQKIIADKITEATAFDGDKGRAHVIFGTAIDDPEARQRNQRKRDRGFTLLGVGGVLLGLGGLLAILGGYELGTPNGDFGWAIAVTVGALAGVAGLVLLIVGAAILSRTDAPQD